VAVSAAVGMASCGASSQLDPSADELSLGTWGGDDVGVLVTGPGAHVHIGCTFGDFSAPIALDSDGRFNVPGEYVLNAYPVLVGPPMPAQFAGVVRSDLLTLTVAIHDTIEGKLVLLGPETVRYGHEPTMGPCPICQIPEDL